MSEELTDAIAALLEVADTGTTQSTAMPTRAIAELVEVADTESDEILEIAESLAIPCELFKCLRSVVFFNVKLPGDNSSIEERRRAFEELCDSMPHVSPECLRMLGIGLFSLAVFYNHLDAGELTVRDGARLLTLAATAKGVATELRPAAINDLFEKFQTKQKAVLSEAGRQGAIAKNLGHKRLKEWALGEAKEMKNAHTDIARRLAARLPANFADVSRNPERLIYEALRSVKKPV